ncbi:MAG: gamma-glutamylcyclotransferase [Crocosphaera sp.]
MNQNSNTSAYTVDQIARNHTPYHRPQGNHWQPQETSEPSFYYFAYGSCMCPVDLKRTFGENTHQYVVGIGLLEGYRLGFYRRSLRRNCGVLDVVRDVSAKVEGVLYRLPWRFSDRLDEREEVPNNGYRRESVTIHSQGKVYPHVRTYVVIDKLSQELAPNDWYLNVVLRGAVTCGLSEEYCWNLFNHMYQLQLQQKSLIAVDQRA